MRRKRPWSFWLYFLQVISYFSYSNVDVRSFRFCLVLNFLAIQSPLSLRLIHRSFVFLFCSIEQLYESFLAETRRRQPKHNNHLFIGNDREGPVGARWIWNWNWNWLFVEWTTTAEAPQKFDSAFITSHRHGNWWDFSPSPSPERIWAFHIQHTFRPLT